MTYLAVPISAKDEVQAKAQIGKALAGGAEMLELRMDYIGGLVASHVRALLGEVRRIGDTPVIVTCRGRREGGAMDHPESLRIAVLLEAVRVETAARDLAAARRLFAEFQSRAGKSGWLFYILEARRAGAEIELVAGRRQEGLRQVRALEEDARGQGFGLIAAEAEKLLHEAHP